MLVVWQLEVLNSCQVARLGNSSVSAPGRKQEAEQQSLCSQDQLGNPAQAQLPLWPSTSPVNYIPSKNCTHLCVSYLMPCNKSPQNLVAQRSCHLLLFLALLGSALASGLLCRWSCVSARLWSLASQRMHFKAGLFFSLLTLGSGGLCFCPDGSPKSCLSLLMQNSWQGLSDQPVLVAGGHL